MTEPTPAAEGPGALPPALAERAARRRAQLAAEAQHPPPPPTAPAPTAPAATAGRPSGQGQHVAPKARTSPGSASRLALAGGAIGLGFGLVGVMAAASHDAAAPPAIVQRVVVPSAQTAPPTQLIVMLPESAGAPIRTIDVSATGAVTIPEPASAPVSAASSTPVAKSSGS